MFNIVPYKTRPVSTDKLFDRFFDDLFSWEKEILPSSRRWSPPVDFSEDESSYHLTMELPGINKEELDISVENNVLIISGEKKKEQTGSERRTERWYGKFSRSFSVPNSVDKTKMRAKYDDGILVLSVPKLPAKRPQKIAIE